MMRRTTRGLGLLMGLALVAGCKDTAATFRSTAGPAQATPSTAGVAVGDPSPGRAKAEEFLKALSEGKATPDDLTAAFRKTLSQPKAEDADADVKKFFGQFEKLTVEDVTETAIGTATVLRGRAKTPGTVNAFCLRVVREGDGYKVDWLHRADRFLAGSAPKTADSELAAAADAARNFVETLVGGDLRQTQALMAPKWTASLGEPGFVIQKLRSWRGETVAYALPAADLVGDTATVTAELEANGQKTTYRVTLKKDAATGRWLVEDFAKA